MPTDPGHENPKKLLWWVPERFQVTLFFFAIRTGCLLALFGAVVAPIVYFFVLFSPFLFQGRTIVLMERHRHISFAVFVVLAGGLYLLRSRLLLAYAAIEIVGGIALGWNMFKSGSFTDGFLAWTAFMASVYLLVRGLDNLFSGVIAIKDALKLTYCGGSFDSMADAINKATHEAFTKNVSSYYSSLNWTETPLTFLELESCEIVSSTVRMRTDGIFYEVQVKASVKTKKRDHISDAKYEKLKEHFGPMK